MSRIEVAGNIMFSYLPPNTFAHTFIFIHPRQFLLDWLLILSCILARNSLSASKVDFKIASCSANFLAELSLAILSFSCRISRFEPL
jgi:hypothetical protein